jgi:hypothetical protein
VLTLHALFARPEVVVLMRTCAPVIEALGIPGMVPSLSGKSSSEGTEIRRPMLEERLIDLGNLPGVGASDDLVEAIPSELAKGCVR